MDFLQKTKVAGVCAVLLLAGSVFAGELVHVDFRSPETGKKAIGLTVNRKQAEASFALVPDGACCTVVKPGKHVLAVEFYAHANVKIVAGNRYILRFRATSDRDLKINASCYLNHPKWTMLAKEASQMISLSAGRWTDVEIPFLAAIDAERVRLPSLRLGRVPAGSKITLQSVTLEGPDHVKEPPLRYGNEPAIAGFAKKICWDLTRAWQRNTAERRRFSLAAYWQIAPAKMPEKSTPACYLMIPGSWRGANASAAVRDKSGKPVSAIAGKNFSEYEDVEISRTFFAPANWRGKNIRLKCDYLRADSEVILNGKSLGKFGPDDDFIVNCDLSSAVRFDAENQLRLKLHSTAKRGQLRGGVLDAIWLDVQPERNFGLPVVETMLSEGKTNLHFQGAAPGLDGTLSLTFRDAATGEVVERRTMPYAERVSIDYIGPKLWDLKHPNLYFLELTLTDGAKRVLDTEKIRFGFRELSVRGKDYLLNGKPIRLLCDSSTMAAIWEPGFTTSPDAYRNRLLTLKRMRHTSCYVTRSEQSTVFQVADEVGFLAMPQVFLVPYREQEKLTDDQAQAIIRKGLSQAVKIERYRNHPSIAVLVTDIWYNLHPGSHHPEYFGIPRKSASYPNFDSAGNIVPGTGKDPNVSGMRLARQSRLEKINRLHKEFFPGALAITGGSGEVGQVYSTHLYHTWGAPVQELRAFAQRYMLKPSLPLFIGEMNIPYPMSYYYPIMTPNQKRPMYYENAVRFFGNRAYRYMPVTGPMHSVLYEQSEKGDKRRYSFVSALYGDVLSRIMRDTMSAWRLQGVNGLGAFGYAVSGSFLMAGVERSDRLKAIPDAYSLPWIEPEFLSRGAYQPPHSHAGEPDMRPVAAGAEFLAAWNPVAMDFFGAGQDLWESDHAFWSGETVRKKIAIMNDLPHKRSFQLKLSLRDATNNRTVLLTRPVKVDAFSSHLELIEFSLPKVSVRSDRKLIAELIGSDESKSTITRTMAIEIFPPVTPPVLKRKLLVFDPEGKAKEQLKRWNVPFETISDLHALPDGALVLAGRKSLAKSAHLPDLNALTNRGIRVLVLEQDQAASMELMNARERYAFGNDQAHPVLSGFSDCDFALWRGSSAGQPGYQIGSVGQSWSNWGNRNMVAGTVFRRPTQGNYRALLTSGFDLFQTPLLEYSGDRGAWIGCQLEISGRLGTDPVPTTLLAKMLTYLDERAVRDETSATAFFGGSDGRKLLDKLQVEARTIADLTEKSLEGVHTLLIADPDFAQLEKYRFEINAFVHAGNRLIYLQTGRNFSPSWLPFTMNLERQKLRNARAQSRTADGLWLAGYDDNDFACERDYEIPVFTGFPAHWDAYKPGVLLRAPHGEGDFVFCSVAPELFGRDYAAHKTARFLAALLTSAGVKIRTETSAYMVSNGVRPSTLDLSVLAWQFALDPQDVGPKE
ncbi:MAG: hypothetical protein PHS41_01315, partial [Victivallaceae bacterium]|nr:hypothetical protein [Victivallaceae bacterium]